MTIQSIAELAHRQIFPDDADDAPITLVEFIETAKAEYAYQLWVMNRQEWQQEGENNIPPNLLSETTLTVINKQVDISKLEALRSLPQNTWIQNLGGFDCGDCRYVLMDINKWKILCDDESRTPQVKAAIVVGKTIRFPDGTFDAKGQVSMIFANMGGDVDTDMQIDDAVGGIVRRTLIDIYSKKSPTDSTNNSNPNI